MFPQKKVINPSKKNTVTNLNSKVLNRRPLRAAQGYLQALLPVSHKALNPKDRSKKHFPVKASTGTEVLFSFKQEETPQVAGLRNEI